jgi:hypothetical protein
MFASRVTKVVKFGDADVVIRKISAKSLSKAARAHQTESLNAAREAGSDIIRMIRSESLSDDVRAQIEARKRDPELQRQARYESFDRDLVLLAGVQSITGIDTVNLAVLEDLDLETSQKLHEEILDLSLPPLTLEEAQAEEGKG